MVLHDVHRCIWLLRHYQSGAAEGGKMLSSQQSYNYYVRNGGPWHRAGDWTGLILIPGGCSLGHRHYRLEHKVLVTHGLLALHRHGETLPNRGVHKKISGH